MKSRLRLGPPKNQVGGRFADPDAACQSAIRLVAIHALTGACPDPAIRIEAEAVEHAVGQAGKDVAAGKPPFLVDRKTADMARAVGAVRPARIGNVEQAIIG